ncbi:MAG TPA: helix-hairpin-helix domain-containing protein, partial [Candidatus Paceibacterota bacterium]|nr:helix-hairpin-helix domain-containing protein [Candidatus Paceibacterota bacterium]
IIKSGKIIPKLHKIIEAKGELNIPKTCPSCDFPTEIKDGNNDSQSLVCNNVDCPAQNIKNLNHYLKALDIKGIAEKNIERLVDAGLILKRSDFYNLTLETLLDSGITERTAILTLARIWMIPNPEQEKDNTVLKNKLKTISKITIPMEKFIASFGMDGAGKEVGKLLSKKYQNFDKIRNLTISELESVDGIGLTIAQNVVDFFSKNKKEIDALLQFIIFETLEKKSGKLDGKTFVLSGSLEGGKAMWQKIIEEQGGIIKSGVSKNIDYLISGEGSGLKTTKALELGIPILTTDDLEKLLN